MTYRRDGESDKIFCKDGPNSDNPYRRKVTVFLKIRKLRLYRGARWRL